MQVAGWHIELEFSEDDVLTKSAALLRLPDGTELRAHGHARRNPQDPAQARIGEEIAGARALSALAHQLIDKAADEIEATTHQPAHLVN
jgi:hypothetical protein